MGVKKNPLRVRAVGNFPAAGLATLSAEQVPHDTIWCIQRLTFEGSLATALGNTRARVYIAGHGYNLYLAEQVNPAANNLYWMIENYWLIPGERVCLEWDQAQAGTVLQMHLIGYWHDLQEGIIT